MKNLTLLIVTLLVICSCNRYCRGWAYEHLDELCPKTIDSNSIAITKDSTAAESKEKTENPDSTFLYLWFGCDSLNNVYCRDISEKDSIINNLKKGNIDYKYLFKNGQLKLSMFQDSIVRLNKRIEVFIKEKSTTSKTTVIPQIEKNKVDKTWRIYALIVSGVFILFIVLLFGAIKSAITSRVKESIKYIKED